jgi:oligoribonuclease NrnB/cAMP/cGMP phosphodiesterase (DHH superfamily)
MLQITIPQVDMWDEQKEEFISSKERTLQLEHSLVSLSKWESRWCKAFLSNKEMTAEESIDYIRCMTITQNVPDDVYNAIPDSIIKEVSEYMALPMTATWFTDEDKKTSSGGETVTAELIYYWMISLNIPMECQKWHLNRLLTLIKVCNIKNQPPKKRSKKEIMSRNAALNAARKKQFNTSG